MNSLKENWKNILESVRTECGIKDVPFKTWLEPLIILDVKDNILTLGYPASKSPGMDDESFITSYILKHYGLQLRVAIQESTGIEYTIRIRLSGNNEESQPKEASPSYLVSNLNEKYTFNNFVVGNNNRFAQQAALAVAETPGESYNPLYIYGGPGLGKTHLLHAIGNYILEENPSMKVLYVTSETFTNEVIESIRNSSNTKAMSKFREKYRMVDVLMIDDIQFIIGKESTQEEFFHTFNTLQQAGKQIVITSDRSPKEMKTLEERVRTRFEMGLMADIGLPEYELRMAILRKKSEEENFKISDDILDYIAANVKSNVRELEGAFTKLMAFSRLENTEITMDIAVHELQNIIDPDKPREITPQTIIEVVCEHFSVSLDQMTGKNRSNDIARPRQIAMFLCKNMTDCSLEVIGSFLGNRNHSTIIHGVQKIADEYENDSELKSQIDVIKKKIRPL